MSDSAASIPDAIVWEFQNNGVKFPNRWNIDNKPVQSSAESFQCLLEIIGKNEPEESKVEQSEIDATKIEKALRDPYENEDAFDQALFMALKESLRDIGLNIYDIVEQKCVKKDEEDKSKFFLIEQSKSQSHTYALGFGRKVCRSKVFAILEDEEVHSTSMEQSSKASRLELDHACCIFRKKGDNWDVIACLSVVELKIGNTSSCWDKSWSIFKPDPILQPLKCALDLVWPSICRLGIGNSLSELPFALIAARKTGEEPKKKRKRSVRGTLRFPESWNDSFRVRFHGSEAFIESSTNKEEEESIKKTADVYVETMLSGMKAWKLFLELLKENDGKLLFPSPLSGPPPDELFEPQKKEYTFCGSPLWSSETVEEWNSKNKEGKERYVIYQGELHYFHELDFEKLRMGQKKRQKSIFIVEKQLETNVLVKVWSKTVHRHLQDSGNYIEAIDYICRNSGPEKDLKEELSKVLLGVMETPTGTLTVMRNINGKPVKVKENPLEMLDYWKSFRKLVERTLIPLANEDVIYQDLRPGYDTTYNVLIRKLENGEKEMLLIDYESLCLEEMYESNDKRYPYGQESVESRAHYVLYLQCVGVAYTWLSEKNAKDFEMKDAISWWSKELKPPQDSVRDWWLNHIKTTPKIDHPLVSLLDHVTKLIEERDAEGDERES